MILNWRILFFLGALLLESCIKNSNYNLGPSANSKYVVEGGINGLFTQHSIRITQVSSSTLTEVIPVSGLLVKVTGGGENMVFTESSKPGVYSCTLSHKLKLNQKYSLAATSADNSRQIFATDTLFKVYPIKGSPLPFTVGLLKSGKVEFQIPKHVFGQKYPLKWLLVSKTGKVWDPQVFDGAYPFTYMHQLGAPNVLYSLTTISTLQDFDPTDSIEVFKFSLSSSHGIYLYSIFEETEWKGLFSGAPSQVIGNISQYGQGFFSAMDLDRRKYRVRDLLGKKNFF